MYQIWVNCNFFGTTGLVKYGLAILLSYVMTKWKFLNFVCVFLRDWFENEHHRCGSAFTHSQFDDVAIQN